MAVWAPWEHHPTGGTAPARDGSPGRRSDLAGLGKKRTYTFTDWLGCTGSMAGGPLGLRKEHSARTGGDASDDSRPRPISPPWGWGWPCPSPRRSDIHPAPCCSLEARVGVGWLSHRGVGPVGSPPVGQAVFLGEGGLHHPTSYGGTGWKTDCHLVATSRDSSCPLCIPHWSLGILGASWRSRRIS